jgi:hypothetical protein
VISNSPRLRLLLDAERPAAGIELDHPVALRILHRIGEHGRAALALDALLHERNQVVPEEDVVAEDQRDAVAADEIAPEGERLRNARRAILHGVSQAQAPLRAVTEQLLEARRVLRRGDDQDVADAGEHERRQRVIHHRLVVDRQQLLRDHLRGRVEPRAGAAGEQDALHRAAAKCCSTLSMYQRTVFSSPDSKLSRGRQPSSRRILSMFMA